MRWEVATIPILGQCSGCCHPWGAHRPTLLILLCSWYNQSAAQRYKVVMTWKHFPHYWSFVRGIHLPWKPSNVELSCFLYCLQAVVQTVELQMIWDAEKLMWRHWWKKPHIDGLVQNCSISIANALEILQSCQSHRNVRCFSVSGPTTDTFLREDVVSDIETGPLSLQYPESISWYNHNSVLLLK